MAITVNAIYENGVLKPLEDVSLKEREKVKIDINPDEKLKKRFKKIADSIYKRTNKYPAREIENDITLASKEVRDID
jgi:predicted DNA-binding antitoxin AbrB/MazE fold protein